MKKTAIIILVLLSLGLFGFYRYYNFANKNIKNNTQSQQNKLPDFPQEIIKMLEDESYKKVKPFYITTYVQDPKNPALQNPKKVYVNGIMAEQILDNKADRTYNNLYQKLKNKGYLIFLTNMSYDTGDNMMFDVAVIKGTDQYDILKLIKPEGLKYNIKTDDIIKKLKEWEKTMSIQIMVVDRDAVEAIILKMPTDITKFAEETYKFAPDVIDTGKETVKDLAKDIQKYEYFWLWWE